MPSRIRHRPDTSRAELTADMRALFARDGRHRGWALSGAAPLDPDPAGFLRRSALYFRDLAKVDARATARSTMSPLSTPTMPICRDTTGKLSFPDVAG